MLGKQLSHGIGDLSIAERQFHPSTLQLDLLLIAEVGNEVDILVSDQGKGVIASEVCEVAYIRRMRQQQGIKPHFFHCIPHLLVAGFEKSLGFAYSVLHRLMSATL